MAFFSPKYLRVGQNTVSAILISVIYLLVYLLMLEYLQFVAFQLVNTLEMSGYHKTIKYIQTYTCK